MHKCEHICFNEYANMSMCEHVQAFQVVIVVKNLPAKAGEVRCGFEPWIGKIPWWRAQQSIPVFLPGESHGERSLAG